MAQAGLRSATDPSTLAIPVFIDTITLGPRFERSGLLGSGGSRSLWRLGHIFTSLLTLDPVSGKVFAFPGCSSEPIELHRDIESLVFALIELWKVEIGHDRGVDPEILASRFRDSVGSFDPTPLADEESQWNLSMEELEHGIW
ncbi:SUKH-4 family immunity protein [Streptomyces toxytricini]|uniref:SUKH-4 family immunity protein n=1 Tax=Streptomyces toxytricini TaxID=67369 RepID=A0ABW8EFG2_STRT5